MYRLQCTYDYSHFLQDAFIGCNLNTCNLETNIYTKRVRPVRLDYIFYSSDRCPAAEMEVQVGSEEERGERSEG